MYCTSDYSWPFWLGQANTEFVSSYQSQICHNKYLLIYQKQKIRACPLYLSENLQRVSSCDERHTHRSGYVKTSQRLKVAFVCVSLTNRRAGILNVSCWLLHSYSQLCSVTGPITEKIHQQKCHIRHQQTNKTHNTVGYKVSHFTLTSLKQSLGLCSQIPRN